MQRAAVSAACSAAGRLATLAPPASGTARHASCLAAAAAQAAASCAPAHAAAGRARSSALVHDAASVAAASCRRGLSTAAGAGVQTSSHSHASPVDHHTHEPHSSAGEQGDGAATLGPGGRSSFQLSGRAAYLDLQATTPLDPRVLDAMMPYYVERWGNPHSRTHGYGWEAEAVVEKARAQVASLIGADAKEIIFTSGATESNNMAIKGVARFHAKAGVKRHVITTQTEHKCVLDSCRWLESEGWSITYLPVGTNGLIDMAQLEAAIRPETVLVSIMGVNNEIGVTQPLKAIGALCRSRKVFFHTDAAQMVGKVPLNVEECNIDLLSISGHKIYGPKGIGALYVRRRPRVRLEPLISGGGQERGLRSGTLPHPLVAGLGAACEIAARDMEADSAWVEHLSKRLREGIMSQITHVVLNGDGDARYPGNVNLSFAYVEGESLLMALKNIAVSSGSACTSASLEPSYVLRAIGVEDELAHTSIRFGLGRFTTEAEVDFAVDLCVKHVTRLREMSPLWEMVQEGVDLKTIQWSQEH